MPRWTFELTPGTLSGEEKATIATQATKLYTDHGIPAFLFNLFFHENPLGCFYSGGKSPPNAVFFVIDHAAREFTSEEVRLAFIERINAIVRPILEPKGVKWEYNIYEHPRNNWRVNGMVPPIDHPEVWQQWVERNEPVPY